MINSMSNLVDKIMLLIMLVIMLVIVLLITFFFSVGLSIAVVPFKQKRSFYIGRGVGDERSEEQVCAGRGEVHMSSAARHAGRHSPPRLVIEFKRIDLKQI